MGMPKDNSDMPEGAQPPSDVQLIGPIKEARKWYHLLPVMRAHSGLSQDALLDLVSKKGVVLDQPLYSKWETGKRKHPPERSVLMRLAEANGFHATHPLTLRLRHLAHEGRPISASLYPELLRLVERILDWPESTEVDNLCVFKALHRLSVDRPAVAEAIVEAGLAEDPQELPDWVSQVINEYRGLDVDL